jgi:hypothetical protein
LSLTVGTKKVVILNLFQDLTKRKKRYAEPSLIFISPRFSMTGLEDFKYLWIEFVNAHGVFDLLQRNRHEPFRK